MATFAFFVNSSFQLFMALLVVSIKKLNRHDAFLYLSTELEEQRQSTKLREYFTVTDDARQQYDTVYFFTTVYPSKEIFDSLRCGKRILVYEGLTTYYTEYWASLFGTWEVSAFDEVWVPSPELVENPRAARYVPLDCRAFLQDKAFLRKFAEDANEIFRFDKALAAAETEHSVLLFDRYFERWKLKVFNHNAHRLLTIFCAALFGDKLLVKLHPAETMDFCFDGFGFDILQGRIPNELIYANAVLDGEVSENRVYILYNSSAAVNYYSLFGSDGYVLLCIGGLLDRYGIGQEDTLIAFSRTKEVLRKLRRISRIRVFFPESVEELAHAVWQISEQAEDRFVPRYSIDDALWAEAEERFGRNNHDVILQLRAFRMQLELALLAQRKTGGRYFLNADNNRAKDSREILRLVLPSFRETANEKEADIEIDCRYRVDYAEDTIDIKRFKTVECFSMRPPLERDVARYVEKADNLYIWGVTESNRETFQAIKELGAEGKIRQVFDSRATGFCQGFPVTRFAPSELERNSFIFVCARAAYEEIAEILRGHGYEEGRDFTFGVGIRNRSGRRIHK